MDDGAQERRWFWATLILSSISIIALVFAFWELVENRYFRDLNYVSLHYLYISRGIASSLLLAVWAAYFVLRQRRLAEHELRRSRERYRGILEASPEAVALYDSELRVVEWNATAERLYGFSKEEVAGQPLPTVDDVLGDELREFMREVTSGRAVLERETRRRARDGSLLDVQISVLPFREGARQFFLEVAADIRERVRLRATLIELEKLTTMGKMAAGTAHHLNTPLASMLLRVQMMRQKASDNGGDLAQLESAIGFCQQFVRRLLEFSRRPAPQKQREEIAGIVGAVLGFLSPSLQAKHVHVSCDTGAAGGLAVLADRNQLETLLLILLSNALDAMNDGGSIAIAVAPAQPGQLEISIADSGCGISDADRERVFEPFFTTKPPGKGTGLGLAIARNIVAEHGGSIRLQRNRPQGTQAVIELPMLAEEPVAAVPQEVS
ncbi:MAG TPA: ATP-binding protein [Terriglobales bacterium]|nr:ATP-binding protein [Terriglobales bacterium]